MKLYLFHHPADPHSHEAKEIMNMIQTKYPFHFLTELVDVSKYPKFARKRRVLELPTFLISSDNKEIGRFEKDEIDYDEIRQALLEH